MLRYFRVQSVEIEINQRIIRTMNRTKSNRIFKKKKFNLKETKRNKFIKLIIKKIIC